MTPIFFHDDQRVDYDFISVHKIPLFVRNSGRQPHTFKPVAMEHLFIVHDEEYVRGVFEGTTENGFGTRDPQINQALLASNGSMIAAAQHAMAFDGVACSASQGFHHAHYDYGYGYCTFNGLMLTAKTLLDRGSVESVLIIDGDGHYGDGTNDIIKRLGLSERVFNVTRNVHLGPEQSDWSSVRWADYTRGLIDGFKPGIILYQAGADACVDDPYGAGYLSLLGMMKRDLGIFAAAKESGVPLVWNLAGGYSDPIDQTLGIHLETLNQSDRVYYGRT